MYACIEARCDFLYPLWWNNLINQMLEKMMLHAATNHEMAWLSLIDLFAVKLFTYKH
jgi:hypothetical protein